MTGKIPVIRFEIEAIFRKESAAKSYACDLIQNTGCDIALSSGMASTYETFTVTATGVWTNNLADVSKRLAGSITISAGEKIKLDGLSVEIHARNHAQAAKVVSLALEADCPNFSLETDEEDETYPETKLVTLSGLHPTDFSIIADAFREAFPEN